MELRHDAEVGRRPEGDDFAFAFDQQPDGYALYAAGRERRPHLLPQHGREFEAHQTVQYAARLLRVDEVHVDRAGILDGFEDRPFGDFVENDALRLIDREAQHFGQVPCDSLAFAVFIGCEPHGFRVAGQLRQFVHDFLLVARNLVDGFESVVDMDAEILFRKVTDVPETRFHDVVFPEEFFDGFRFGGRLDDY